MSNLSKLTKLASLKNKLEAEVLAKKAALEKIAKVLSEEDREKIKLKDYAIVEDGKPKYPIEDIEHAKNALARVSQFGTPEEKKKVREAVYAKYPELAEHKLEEEGKKEE
ncbi:MAG: hypothetical protein ACP5JE_04605, partial [Thermoplasmata archaeon]